MSIVRKFTNTLKSFTQAERGTVALITGIAAIPLCLSVGVAVDFSRHLNAETNVQQALDAGALAGAAALGAPDKTRIDLAKKAFDANLNRNQIGKTDVKFRIEKGYMKASVDAEVKTTFMSLAGIENTNVTAEAEVNLLSIKKAEIAMVLDYSGSMDTAVKGERKYVSMRKAATKLVDDLSKLDKGKIKMGLVPFSHHVYVTLPKNAVRGQKGTGSWTGCTVDRLAPYNTTNLVPSPTNDNTKWGQPFFSAYPGNPSMVKALADSGCDGYAPRDLKVTPISDKLDDAKSQLSRMRPYAWTHIALGMEFGYQMLTPGNVFAASVAKFKDEDTQKYIVLLTDGSQTAPAYDAKDNNKGDASVVQGEKNLEKLCANAKDDGIKVITLAFALTDKDPSKAEETKDRLRKCASSESLYFDADNGTELSAAFDAIRSEVAQNIFLSK
jgi:Flp pilus assembly protein TadG